MSRVKIFHPTFFKAQFASIAATIVDFGSLALWVEVLHEYYVVGVPIGAALGALTNFLINRYWSFEAANKPIGGQAVRYLLVSAGSLILNTYGVYALTEGLSVQYLASKAIVSLLVGILYNYPLHRYFVYRYKEAL